MSKELPDGWGAIYQDDIKVEGNWHVIVELAKAIDEDCPNEQVQSFRNLVIGLSE